MRLNTALTLFIILSVLALLILTLVFIKITDRLEQEIQAIARTTESIEVAEKIKSALLEHNREANLYLLRGLSLGRQDRAVLQAKLIHLINLSEHFTDSKEEGKLVEAVRNTVTAYFTMRDQPDSGEISPLERYGQIGRYVDAALAEIDKLIILNAEQARRVQGKAAAQNKVTNLVSFWLIALSALIGTVLLASAVQFVYRPLFRLKTDIASYEGGEAVSRAEVKGVKEIRDIALAFNFMAEQLEQQRRDQLRFIASVAHDLRNPLNAISLATAVALREKPTHAQELFQLVQSQVGALERMVTDLLDASRIEAGQLQLSYSQQDICSLVRNAVKLYCSTSKVHRFEMMLPDYPVLCLCDPHRLSQVLNNLLSNAIKYSPNGGKIAVSLKVEQKGCVIGVADEGIGIAPENLDNIFKAFHRTPETRNTIPGVGLGLSASKRIIEAHGGAIQVQSTPGKGTLFSVFIPLKLPE